MNILTSPDNINYLVDIIFQNFKLKASSRARCDDFIRNRAEHYFSELVHFPDDKTQIADLIQAINEKCFSDFEAYSVEKFGAGIYRKKGEIVMQIIDSRERDALYETLLADGYDMSFTTRSTTPDSQADILRILSDRVFLTNMMDMIQKLNHRCDTISEKICDEILDARQVSDLMMLLVNPPAEKYCEDYNRESSECAGMFSDCSFVCSPKAPSVQPSAEPSVQPSVQPSAEPNVQPVIKQDYTTPCAQVDETEKADDGLTMFLLQNMANARTSADD